MGFFKTKIKHNSTLRSFICTLSRIINALRMPNSVRGKDNQLNFSKTVFFKRVKIVIKGDKNIIKINSKAVLRNLKIEIEGSNNQLILGEEVRVYENANILISGSGSSIVIGNKTTIGSGKIFCAESNTHIKIGEDCMFGREIRVATGDFHSVIDLQTNKRINQSKNIQIGHHVWIGFHASVTKGSTILDNSVVASYTLVNKENNEANVILAGVPARIIRRNINWDRKLLPVE
jgi:acetyltransferase-like isoleucine patch superfamily enzyme